MHRLLLLLFGLLLALVGQRPSICRRLQWLPGSRSSSHFCMQAQTADRDGQDINVMHETAPGTALA